MAESQFSTLMSPLQLGPVTIRNRIVFTGHETLLQSPDGSMSEEYLAYQAARARGGAGLQVLGAAAIDEFSATTPDMLSIRSDEDIPGLTRMAEAVHAHGGAVFAQLLHPGREVYGSPDGTMPFTLSASDTASERFRTKPRAMTRDQIRAVVLAYGAAAERAVKAGLDGVEIVGNQGNLPAQFLAEACNKRTDEYGGSLENRLRFLLEAARAVRQATLGKIAFGFRISADEFDLGVTPEESMAACRALDGEELVDYLSVVIGTPASRGSSFHIVAPMTHPTGYVGSYSQRIKQAVRVPVMATGRFNTPHAAEAALRNGEADAVGMTRALICDPDLGRKVLEQRAEDVRACIGCVQACIGHYQKHAAVSCIQFPETGRETTLGRYSPATTPRRILVAGGGPAGMKAAAIAAARGHHVTLCEAGADLGGQAQLAQRLPHRAEFGGIITNLKREIELAGVVVRKKTWVDRRFVESEAPDVVIIATGGMTARPDLGEVSGIQVISADELLRDNVRIGKRVVIADRQADWVGIGLAEKLARAGHHVRLATAGIQPGEFIPLYLRDIAAGQLFDAGVEVTNYARLYGADGDTAYFEHIVAHKPIVFEGVDTLVTCFGQDADRRLEYELDGLGVQTHIIGDCLTPRTAEEAVLEGLKVARIV